MSFALALGLAFQLAVAPPPQQAPLVIGFPDAERLPSAELIGVARLSPALSPVEYSDLYYRRLTLHRWASWTMLPLFAAQYVAGSELAKGEGASDWAEDLHPVLALGVGTLFGVNTVTGAWNLWDGRKDPEARGRRITHAALMLLADAGFVATAVLADKAEDDGSGVAAHRTMALSSIAVSTLSWTIMLDVFRPE